MSRKRVQVSELIVDITPGTTWQCHSCSCSHPLAGDGIFAGTMRTERLAARNGLVSECASCHTQRKHRLNLSLIHISEPTRLALI
eukprot:14199821-Alexandrium_andersonii.AAC.1